MLCAAYSPLVEITSKRNIRIIWIYCRSMGKRERDSGFGDVGESSVSLTRFAVDRKVLFKSGFYVTVHEIFSETAIDLGLLLLLSSSILIAWKLDEPKGSSDNKSKRNKRRPERKRKKKNECTKSPSKQRIHNITYVRNFIYLLILLRLFVDIVLGTVCTRHWRISCSVARFGRAKL